MIMGCSRVAAAAVCLGAFVAVDRAEAGAAQYTTLHGATYSSSYNSGQFGSGTLSLAYHGFPTNSLTDVQAYTGLYDQADSRTSYEAGFTIGDGFSYGSFANMDKVGFELATTHVSGAWSSFTTTITWDVTFATAVGLDYQTHGSSLMSRTWTVTDSEGNTTVANFQGSGLGTVLQSGRYTITLTGTRNTAASWDTASFYVQSLGSNGGGAVPGPGAAMIASMGLAGISRRRRR